MPINRNPASIEYARAVGIAPGALTLAQSGQLEGIGRLYQELRMLGFNTYREQYQGLHMNQTLAGVAFGREAQR